MSLQKEQMMLTALFTTAVLVGFVAVLVINGGHFTYMLDDPYIHLAVAESLAGQGHYGVNPSEVSAPCSSPLWPFLMMPFARLPGFDLVPLAVSWLAAVLTIRLLHGRIGKVLPDRPGGESGTVQRLALSLFVVLGCNFIGLVFTGMEHSVQVLLAVAVVEGMLRLTEERKAGWWFAAAVVTGPWIRYENLVFTAAAVGFLLRQRMYLRAVALGILAAAGLAAFSGYLMSLGLDPVPASIRAKSAFVEGNPLIAALRNLKASMANGRGLLVALLSAVLCGMALVSRQRGPWRAAAWLLAGAGGLHLVAGAYGWVNRYEIYILTSLLVGLLGIGGIVCRQSIGRLEPRHALLLLPLLPVTGFPYLLGLVNLPTAANNIHEQHYQMHRFVTEFWKKPVAVHDLGYVSYRNPEYVLDLWGLASPEALRRRTTEKDPAWMKEMAERHGIKLAMIYDPWFPDLPASWRKVGSLALTRKCAAPAWHEVSFYATDEATVPQLILRMEKFNKTAPVPITVDFPMKAGIAE
jgi:hypothetical protein